MQDIKTIKPEDLLQELSLEDYDKLLADNSLKRGSSLNENEESYAEQYPPSLLDLQAVNKQQVINSESLNKEPESFEQPNLTQVLYSDVQRLVTREEKDRFGHKVAYFDKPFIKNQAKTAPHTVRLLRKRVEVLDLGEPHDLERFNDLLTQSADGFANISNLTYSIKAFDTAATWKALVSYDLLEFQNPLNK